MALQLRKVTEADRLLITPIPGEPLYTVDENKLYIGDGVTPGGVSVISTIEIRDFLNVELDGEDIEDGSFIYYDKSQNKWRIGKPVIFTSDLDDVTLDNQVDAGFMFVYDAATERWVIQEQPVKSLDDIAEFSIDSNLLTQPLALEYNETSDLFESRPLAPIPAIGDLLGVSVSDPTQRGHVFLYDKDTSTFVNDYISLTESVNYNADLHGLQNLDIIKFDGQSNLFKRDAPFLKDVYLISLDGLNEPAPEDAIIPVNVSGGKFVFNEVQVAPELEIFKDRNYSFDLSDPSLLGKTFSFSEVFDGTHSLDPPGEILVSERIILSGTPGIDGSVYIDLRSTGPDLGQLPDEFYYFCVEDPEFGGKILQKNPLVPPPFVLQWDQSIESFNTKRFGYSLGEFGDVLLTPDEDGNIADFQMLSWDDGNKKWTTPLDRVVGLGIGGTLPRTYTQYSNAMWAGGVQGLGTFDLTLEEGAELKSIKINLDELEIEGQEEEFDAFFFDSEEEREEFLEAVEAAQAALGPGGFLTREEIDAIADEKQAKKARLISNKKEYTRTGKSALDRPRVEIEAGEGGPGGGGWGGGGFGTFGGIMGSFAGLSLGSGDGSGDGYAGGDPGVDEPGLDELTSPVPSPEEEAEAFKDAYKNFGNNLKKTFGALLARNRLLKKLYPDSFNPDGTPGGLSAGGGLEIEFETVNPTGVQSQDKPPMMLGWRASTDVYSYYYFTYFKSSAALTYNSRDHELMVQSKMRRVGCTLTRGNTFKVCFYYDADDSRYMAGEWLRIVEWLSPKSLYTGDLEEFPSVTIRKDLEEWNAGTKYKKGSRVIYNDKVWECLVEISEASPPAPGIVPAPSAVDNEAIQAFVEIPAFSVKSQLFSGVYQLRCTLGKDTFGGKTHPVFGFGEPGDEADYLYVGASLRTPQPTTMRALGYTDYVQLYQRDQHRQNLNTYNLDRGTFLYDINVHSALQHLMVGEFQTFNIEKRLGECNLPPTSLIPQKEIEWAMSMGNRAGATPPKIAIDDPGPGIPSYRGIFRPYGNIGCFIDGLNINALTGAASFNLDSNLHVDVAPQPPGYTFLENLPRPALTNGTGQSFISNFFTWRRTDYSDFAFFLPKTLGGGKDTFMGDRIHYRDIPSTESLVVPSVGSPFAFPINQIDGGNGPFSMNISRLAGGGNVFATRYCVKRRGSTLTPKTAQVGEKALGTITDQDGNIIKRDVEESEVQPGQTWTQDKVVPIYQIIPGNDKASGEAGTSTVSLARIEAGKSAVCIGVCDESSNGLYAFQLLWDEFRGQFPNRPHWLLQPSSFSPENTAPFPTSILSKNPSFDSLFSANFPNVSDFYPVSRNQRTSFPLTHNLGSYLFTSSNKWLAWAPELKNHGVFLYDLGFYSDHGPSVENTTATIRYNIRIPVGIDGVKFRFTADDAIGITIYNPVTGSTFGLGSHADPTSLKEYILDSQEVDQAFTPQDLIDQDKWLEVKVIYEQGPDATLEQTWRNNPGGYVLLIDAYRASNGTYYPFFRTDDYGSIGVDIYPPNAVSAMNVPLNYMVDAFQGRPSYGPYTVTRDNGNTSLITDWFALCKLDLLRPGTVIGLFIDRSGSMTQQTIQASYAYFYQRCAEAGLSIVEVQNSNEDWITPFIAEI